jgi:hypothetical protein
VPKLVLTKRDIVYFIFELDISTRKANNIFNELKELIDEKEGDKCFMFNVSDKEDIQGKTSVERIF